MNRQERLDQDGVTAPILFYRPNDSLESSPTFLDTESSCLMSAQDKIIYDIFGHYTYLVGGAVRDEVLDLVPKDRDYLVLFKDVKDIGRTAVNAGYRASAIKVAGKKVGVRISGEGLPPEGVDVCPPRREYSTCPGHQDFVIDAIPADEQKEKPAYVLIEVDGIRRDWTINAMAKHLASGAIQDPFGALEDIANAKLELTYDRALEDDPLRILRGIYLRARTGFVFSDYASGKIFENREGLAHISRERIRDEFCKIILQPGYMNGLDALVGFGLLEYIHPWLAEMENFDQRNEHHNEFLLKHCLSVLDWVVLAGAHPDGEEGDVRIRIAALLHDIGKLQTQEEKGNGYCRYHDHDVVGAEMAYELLTSLRFPNTFAREVSTIVRYHMLVGSGKKNQGRKIRAAVANDKVLMDVYRVRYADAHAHPFIEEKQISALSDLGLKIVMAKNEPCFVKDLAIDGTDVGESGPIVGQILHRLTREVIGDPSLNNREWLLRRAEKLKKELA